MPDIIDFSGRRGALVPLLPKIHEMLKVNAAKNPNLPPPEHIVIWRQHMRRFILDVNRRLFVALDGENLAGVFFYRHGDGKIFFEEVQIAHEHRKNADIIDGFLKKLEFDPRAKDAAYFASERIKNELDKEMLAAKGFRQTHPDGFKPLGNHKQAAGAIKIRYRA